MSIAGVVLRLEGSMGGREGLVEMWRGVVSAGLVVGSLLWGGAAVAQSDAAVEAAYSPAFLSCVDSADGVMTRVRVCIGTELGRQRARLVRARAAGLGRAPAGLRAGLRVGERRWAAGREARCGRVLREQGGATAELAVELAANCVLVETVRRALWWEGRFRG